MMQTDPCETCRGKATKRQTRRFEVRVPPGTEPGAEKVLAGMGEPGRFGAEPGDLRVTVNVRPSLWLERQGDDIRCEVPISLTEAALGARIPVPTVDGVVSMDVPAGVRSVTKLRLRGKGVPRTGARRGPARRGAETRGDQLVTVVIETPDVGASAQVEAVLRELEARCAQPGVLPRLHEQRERLRGAK
jgi:molecular chaperone DnaJ